MIRDNCRRVCESVAEACLASGRHPSEVNVVAAAKYVGPELTAQLVDAGCRFIGENRPQVIWEKHAWFQANRDSSAIVPEWHLIGHLQRNKVRRTLPMLRMIHSVDSLRLAREIDCEARTQQLSIPILLEVNVTNDASKTGVIPDDLWRIVHDVVELPNLRVQGLMAMSSLDADSATIQREFAAVRHLRDQLSADLGDNAKLVELSMGMSGDFREAIAEGATLVRIGSSLWEGLLGE